MGGVVCAGAFCGRFVHYRLEDRLLVGHHSQEAGELEVSWHLGGAATVGGVMMLLNETYGFDFRLIGSTSGQCHGSSHRPADEWSRSTMGALWHRTLLAIVLTYFKIPALAFALGMFIPLELNVPLVVGGAINWWITSPF